MDKNCDVGKALYMAGYTQQQIADKLGVTPVTVSRWARRDNWQELRDAASNSRGNNIKAMYAELTEINNAIQAREEGKRYANNSESLVRNRLVTNIQQLENKYNLSHLIGIGQDLCNWIADTDLAKAQEVADIYDKFVTHCVEKIKNGNN